VGDRDDVIGQWRAGDALSSEVDVCIIGGGASGATAALALGRAGLEVVVLERGPWLNSEDFGADELANINRHYLTPDPDLNPRTVRSSTSTTARATTFSHVPQMVGGGTVHWTGLVPRFQPSDFRQRSVHGAVADSSLEDWPIGYDELEPYYDRVEWELGVSGRAGANIHEGPRRRDYPCPPLAPAPYTKRFRAGCDALGLSSFPTPVAALSTPLGSRQKTVLSPFIERHGDPTGTKSTALNTFVPAALATGRVTIHPDTYVHALGRGARGRVTSAEFTDSGGTARRQPARVFILACGAIESARLWLLSGLPNESGQVGRNLTLHEFSCALATFEEPMLGWMGGGHIGQSTLDFYETREERGFIGGCHVFAAGPRSPWPINFTIPGAPLWGLEAKNVDRTLFNHTMGAAFLLHDLPQESNQVDLDPEVTDSWGLPVARITHRMHPNDLAQARWFPERCEEIMVAAGAHQVWGFPITTITGNASHQHGTLRMGTDPRRCVLDRNCRAYEVPNLYAVDGSSFPTGSGLNPTLTIMANAWRVADGISEADCA
jgi:choline dehydrogenase-like flavoprotein